MPGNGMRYRSDVGQDDPPADTLPIVVEGIPRIAFRYSGDDYRATDGDGHTLRRPFPDLMRQLVLEPAGMAASSFDQPLPPERAAHAASGYIWRTSARVGVFILLLFRGSLHVIGSVLLRRYPETFGIVVYLVE